MKQAIKVLKKKDLTADVEEDNNERKWLLEQYTDSFLELREMINFIDNSEMPPNCGSKSPFIGYNCYFK